MLLQSILDMSVAIYKSLGLTFIHCRILVAVTSDETGLDVRGR
jgi:hypothetical protein